MISQLFGTLVLKELDRVELLTSGGVAYEILVPLSVFETLPKAGSGVSLHTHLVVRDDGWALYGFTTPYERALFQRLLAAKGIGPSLALGMLSALTAERLVRAIQDKDVVTLQSVPRVERKKAEQIILDLADKLADLQSRAGAAGARAESAVADDAIRALVSLGYNTSDAERAVRATVEAEEGLSATEVIRRALARIARRG